jgi:hypothetical protein
MQAMSGCRRCSECRGGDHHWCSEILTEDLTRLQCKHCPATADLCEGCDGSGGSLEDGTKCRDCDGKGVVDVRATRDQADDMRAQQ